MSDILKDLEKISKNIVADESGIARNKKILMAYMERNPIFDKSVVKRFWMPLTPAILAVLVLFISAGISVASQDTIPGDFLYLWKVNVVESIESAFVIGTQHRADYEVERTTKRLQEITELTVKKSVDPEVVNVARKRLEDQVMTASATIEKVASQDGEKALDAAVKLNSTLAAHESVLSSLETGVAAEIKPQVKETIIKIQNTSVDVLNSIEVLKIQTKQAWTAPKPGTDLKIEAESKIKNNQEKLNAVWDLIVALDEKSNLRLIAERNLQSASDALVNADTLFANGAYGDALAEVQAAAQLISNTEALLKASQQSGSMVQEILKVASPLPSVTATPQDNKTPTPLASPTPQVSGTPTVSASPTSSGSLQ